MRRRVVPATVALAVLISATLLVAGINLSDPEHEVTAAQREPGQPVAPIPSEVTENWKSTAGDLSMGVVVDQPNAALGQKISKKSFEETLKQKGHDYAISVEGIEGEPDCDKGAKLAEKFGFSHDPNRMLCVVIVKGEFLIEGPIGNSVTVNRMINIYDGETGAYLGTGTMDLD